MLSIFRSGSGELAEVLPRPLPLTREETGPFVSIRGCLSACIPSLPRHRLGEGGVQKAKHSQPPSSSPRGPSIHWGIFKGL